jgi:hypothetical protein
VRATNLSAITSFKAAQGIAGTSDGFLKASAQKDETLQETGDRRIGHTAVSILISGRSPSNFEV